MSNEDISQLLEQGIDAAKRGDRATGRRLLTQVLEADPANELAWIWLASCVNTLEDRKECLERVLEINPDNARAKQALAAISGDSVKPDKPSRPRREPKPKAEKTGDDAEKSANGNNDWLGIVAIFGALIVAGLILITQLPNLTTPAPAPTITPLPVAVVSPEPTSENTPIPQLPTLPPPTDDGTNPAPRTLPPTFTSTPSPTPTATLTPTATPYPVTEFTLYAVILTADTVAPSLYTGIGDGTGRALVGDDFRDIAIDPSGQFMAFVRDVPTDIDGQTQPRPQLHIAPINDLLQARAITNLTGTILASPSWSPDAQELVFVSNADGDEDIWYTTVEGTGQYSLTDNPYVDIDPEWSPVPNSRVILFASDRDSVGSTEIYVMSIPEPDTPDDAQRLTNADKSSYAPSWNPRGTLITFVSDRNTDADIFVMNSDGSNQQVITVNDNFAEDRNPSFTTDGRYVVFVSNRIGDRFDAYLTTTNGDELIPLNLSSETQSVVQVVYLPELIFRLR
ncbi:MAG: PD40 domain-containing protein [Anaerolineae bacterium]|nr:PD40 domain-containing protein [Anaerolineae bacterium]